MSGAAETPQFGPHVGNGFEILVRVSRANHYLLCPTHTLEVCNKWQTKLFGGFVHEHEKLVVGLTGNGFGECRPQIF